MVKFLVNAGAKLRRADNQKNYPLHIACEMGNYELVEFLTQKMEKVLLEICNEPGETPLLMCCRHGYDPIILLLLKRGANVKIVDRQGRSPLWHIAQKSAISVAEQLIKAGSEADRVADDGTTALFHAAKANSLDMALILVLNGANLGRYHKHSLGSTQEFRQKLFDAALSGSLAQKKL